MHTHFVYPRFQILPIYINRHLVRKLAIWSQYFYRRSQHLLVCVCKIRTPVSISRKVSSNILALIVDYFHYVAPMNPTWINHMVCSILYNYIQFWHFIDMNR